MVFPDVAPVLDEGTDLEQLLRDKTIDEVIVCKEALDQRLWETYVQICSEIGVVFRLYSPFFTMLANSKRSCIILEHRPYTISNTPVNYLSLRLKDIFDRVFLPLY